MKIVLLAAGKLRNRALQDVCDEYADRLQRFGAACVQEVKASTRREPREAVDDESTRLAGELENSDRVFVFDETGTHISSREWAALLSAAERESVKRLVFVLGGAYGMNEALKAKYRKLALSRLTLPHELCRVLALEQLYRARTIQKNLPYHHD